jgi:DNA-binding NarL/FixJ family response regulator
MSLLILTADLMFTSRAQMAARSVGKEAFVAMSVHKAVEQLAANDITTACVDLSAPGVDAAATLTALREASRLQPLRTIAYAPHVHEAKLAAAQAAGYDTVLTRGQFDRGMQEIAASS